METPPEVAAFAESLRSSLRSGDFYKLTLSKPRGGDPELQQLRVRPVDVRGKMLLAFVTRFRSRDLTENLEIREGIDRILEQLTRPFHSAHLFSATGDLQLDFSKRGRPMLQRHKASAAPVAAEHDRVKERPVDVSSPWLRELGVTDVDGRVLPSMSDKWRQINKFVEILGAALPAKGEGPFHLADFGCGKGLLTFAAHGLLQERFGSAARTTGVELRPALVDGANASVRRLNLEGLTFHAGDIRDFPEQPLQGVIALHACDTATDLALHLGIRRGASLIVTAPCCHKEIRPQIRIPSAMAPLLRHGVHLGQEADMLTDSLRVLLLESCGYETSLFEFVSTEHTAKNKMILARKKIREDRKAFADYQALKTFYGVQTHTLETLLQQDGLLTEA